jgi:hypothetical protein
VHQPRQVDADRDEQQGKNDLRADHDNAVGGDDEDDAASAHRDRGSRRRRAAVEAKPPGQQAAEAQRGRHSGRVGTEHDGRHAQRDQPQRTELEEHLQGRGAEHHRDDDRHQALLPGDRLPGGGQVRTQV